MTISDIFDALTSRDRPYKPAVPVERALDILGQERKSGALDGDLLQIFIAVRPWERLGPRLSLARASARQQRGQHAPRRHAQQHRRRAQQIRRPKRRHLLSFQGEKKGRASRVARAREPIHTRRRASRRQSHVQSRRVIGRRFLLRIATAATRRMVPAPFRFAA